MIPQAIILLIFVIVLVFNIINEGEPTDLSFDTWAYLKWSIALLAILYWGGFFNVFFK